MRARERSLSSHCSIFSICFQRLATVSHLQRKQKLMIARRTCTVLAVSSFVLALGGCANLNVEKQSVQSFEIPSTKLKGDAAIGALTAIFVERGFDIKVSNKEGGIVSTEYKKFASVGGSPPFDYFMQIRATLRDAGGGQTVIRLSPLVKEQNRSNAAAFTEHELHYFEGDPRAVQMADRGGWVRSGQTLFMNLVTDVTGRAGVPLDSVKKNITTTQANALMPR